MHSGAGDKGWWYAKIFAGKSSQDAYLSRVIAPLVRGVSASSPEWFFVRYSDRDEQLEHPPAVPQAHAPSRGDHLRVRVRGSLEVIGAWRQSVLSSSRDIAAQVVEEAYEPETSRFGGEFSLSIAHKVFTIDSENTLQLLQIVREEPLASVVTSYDLIARLGLSADEVGSVLTEHVDWVASSIGGPGLKARLMAGAESSWSKIEGRIEQALDAVLACEGYMGEADELKALGDQWRSAGQRGLLGRRLRQILVDVQHMHFNRIGIPPRSECSAVLLADVSFRNGLFRRLSEP